jgi:hypothetical protein
MADMHPTGSIASAAPLSDLPSDLQHLVAAIAALPSEHAAELQPLLDRVVESTGRRRRILTLVQDALGQLRLDMKYLMFDLEATRRERDSYREQVDRLAGDAE